MGFLGPPPACLTSEHYQTGPTLVAREFWILEFFGSPRLVQRSPITSNTLPSWNTICSDNTDHSGVDSFWYGQEVQILYPDDLGDSSTCFSADSGNATLQRKPTAAQDPCVSTSSPVMATRVKWLATWASDKRTREDGTKGDEGATPGNTAGQNE